MQIKLTGSLDYIPVRMATIKNGDTVADDSGENLDY